MIFCLLSFIAGFILGHTKRKLGTNKVNDNRRGLFKRSYTANSPYGKSEEFEVQYELEEIESSTTKSKVHIISYVTDKSEYNTNIYKGKITSMIEGSWILSSEIEWIDDKSKIRSQKIDNILK